MIWLIVCLIVLVFLGFVCFGIAIAAGSSAEGGSAFLCKLFFILSYVCGCSAVALVLCMFEKWLGYL